MKIKEQIAKALSQGITYLFEFIKQGFLSGLAIWIPLVGLYLFLIFVGEGVGNIMPFVKGMQVHWLIKMTFAILVISLTGILFRWSVLKKLHIFGETIIEKVPGISTIYKVLKRLVTGMTGQEKFFKAYVGVDQFGSGVLVHGLITAEGLDLLNNPKVKYANVYEPTVPNPAGGYLVSVPIFKETEVEKSKIKFFNVTVEEGLRMIMSAGADVPTRIRQKKESE